MSAWPERRIVSLRDIQQLAVDIDALWPNSNRCLFRGQSRADWTLQPSLARELVDSTMNWFQVAQLEREMNNRFWREAHRELEPGVSSKKAISLNSWPLMRHFGAPTRVLDWSLSPYVALYFAAEQRWEEDGALWWFRASTAENLMVRKFGAKYKGCERLLFESRQSQVRRTLHEQSPVNAEPRWSIPRSPRRTRWHSQKHRGSECREAKFLFAED